MILVWSNKGYVVPLAFLTAGMLGLMVLEPAGLTRESSNIGSLFFAAALSYLIGKKINAEGEVRGVSTFFWMRVEWWGIIFTAIALYQLLF